MTEDEAKTKWCPFVRTNSIPVDELRIAGEMRCVASECMAWRSIGHLYVSQPPEYVGPAVMSPAGYCGLAGQL